jgi:hypothetical protein
MINEVFKFNSVSVSLFLSLSFLALISKSNDLDDIVSVKFFKPRSHDYFLVVLLSEEQTGLLQALTIESISVFKDLAYSLSVDVLCQYDLALLLDRAYVETISQL